MSAKRNKIIIDTNLWISYLISKGFRRLDKQIFSEKATLIFSQELIDEFIEVTKRPKFAKYFDIKDVIVLLEKFDEYGMLIEVNCSVDICRDPKDNFLLSLSQDSEADFLITGDKDLLDLKVFGQTRILTISDFEQLP